MPLTVLHVAVALVAVGSDRGYRRLQHSGNTQPCVFHTHTWRSGVAIRRAKILRLVVPRPSAKYVKAAVARCDGGTVCRGTCITIPVRILDPLPDVSVHLVETERILGEGSYIERFLTIDTNPSPAIDE